MKVLIKAMRPHRQKVLTEDGQEMRLQQWANKKAGATLRSSNVSGLRPHYSTEQFQQARDALMREAVANPDEHGLKFMGERMPFEGQTLGESLSEPDYGNSPEEQKVFEHLMSLKPEEQEVLSNNRRGQIYTNVSYDSNVGTPTEEEIDQMSSEQQRGFDANKEAEHLRRIMTSRDVAIRDAWSLLKQGPYDREGRYLEHQDINICPEAKAFLQKEMTEGPQFRDKDPNFCNNCDFCYGK